MNPDQGYWIWVWENTLSSMKGVDLIVKGESRSASVGAKVAPWFWKADSSFMNSVTGSGYADPSFMSSVTGSGYVAKCSNILKDRFILVITKTAIS